MSDSKPSMDKSMARGIRPGPSQGVVKAYNAKRAPFGGYIVDDATGIDIFVPRVSVEQAGLDKLEPGQRLKFVVVEDGFGGFKATALQLA